MAVSDLTRCVFPGGDRPGPARQRVRPPVRAAALGAAIGCLALLASPLSAEPRRIEAAIIWVGDAHVFLASREPGAFETGARLTFVRRRAVVATGTIARVLDGEVAIVRLDAGTLAGVRSRDRIEILSVSPTSDVPAVLRLGFPSPPRSNLVFACGAMTVRAPGPPGTYRIEALAGDAWRLVRDPSSARGPWPDTLQVRLFDDAADQEIALERGELDVAVFWPGEASTHLRDGAFWGGGLYGTRARGLIASVAPGLGPEADTGDPDDSAAAGFAALNRQVFRGDLGPATMTGRTTGDAPPTPDGDGLRVAVDARMPGRAVLERFFNGRSSARSDPDTASVTRLFYLDAPRSAPDSLAVALAEHVAAGAFPAALRARADSLRRGIRAGDANEAAPDSLAARLRALDATLRFAIRCPIACAPRLRPVVEAIGPDALADMMECAPGAR